MEPSKPKNGRGRRGGAGGRPRRRRSASPSDSSRHDNHQRSSTRSRSYAENRKQPPPPPSFPPPPPPPAPTGGFSALSSRRDGDNYRPRQGDHRPGGYPQQRNGDSYRPDFRPPQSDFTFNVQAPPGLLPYPPPRGPPRGPGGRRGGDSFRGRRRGGRYSASSRPILTVSNDALPQVFLRDENNVGTKYKSVDELSDDEEHDMDISDDSNSDDGQPAKKRAKVEESPKAGEVPRWSNPDPYTALPPPDPSNRKKKDVVQLIRKARVESEENKDKPVQALDEFISFASSSEESEEEKSPEPENRGTRRERREEARARRDEERGHRREERPQREEEPVQREVSRSDPLGSRKRTADDEIKPPPQGFARKQRAGMELKGTLAPEWLPSPGQDPCPWAIEDHSATTEMGAW